MREFLSKENSSATKNERHSRPFSDSAILSFVAVDRQKGQPPMPGKDTEAPLLDIPLAGNDTDTRKDQVRWEEISKLRRRVASLRDRLFRRRLAMKEKRNELRQERSELAALDSKFMSYVRQFWELDLGADPAHAQRLYEDLQSKRDDVGALQYDYDIVEADHDIAEARFEEEDERLENLLPNFQGDGISSETQAITEGHRRGQSTSSPNNNYDEMQSEPVEPIPHDFAIPEFGEVDAAFTSSLHLKSERPDHLQIELCVQDAISHTISDVEVLAGSKKRSSSERLKESRAKWQVQYGNSELSPHEELQAVQMFEIRLETRSESGLARLQHRFDDSRPSISWWILQTFGSSPVDYIRRARGETLLSASQDKAIDDEQWARLVFDYWKQDQPSATPSEASWYEVPHHQDAELRHSRRLTISDKYLLLSSELSKAKFTLENLSQQFPSTPNQAHETGSPRTGDVPPYHPLQISEHRRQSI